MPTEEGPEATDHGLSGFYRVMPSTHGGVVAMLRTELFLNTERGLLKSIPLITTGGVDDQASDTLKQHYEEIRKFMKEKGML